MKEKRQSGQMLGKRRETSEMPRMLRPRTVFILRDFWALFPATTNMEAVAITMEEGFRGHLPSDNRPMPAENCGRPGDRRILGSRSLFIGSKARARPGLAEVTKPVVCKSGWRSSIKEASVGGDSAVDHRNTTCVSPVSQRFSSDGQIEPNLCSIHAGSRRFGFGDRAASCGTDQGCCRRDDALLR